eukprot:TRINITY_DN4648_c0_g1_i1.p1 TRINITY_DN4648_c0_g1~~TRINITY_DN4648_c0_g1_i1.p1  ORF type:complete len:861 (-),score=152.69 TRINITY_DN4648_c0_g1_i1:220-2616(-)
MGYIEHPTIALYTQLLADQLYDTVGSIKSVSKTRQGWVTFADKHGMAHRFIEEVGDLLYPASVSRLYQHTTGDFERFRDVLVSQRVVGIRPGPPLPPTNIPVWVDRTGLGSQLREFWQIQLPIFRRLAGGDPRSAQELQFLALLTRSGMGKTRTATELPRLTAALFPEGTPILHALCPMVLVSRTGERDYDSAGCEIAVLSLLWLFYGVGYQGNYAVRAAYDAFKAKFKLSFQDLVDLLIATHKPQEGRELVLYVHLDEAQKEPSTVRAFLRLVRDAAGAWASHAVYVVPVLAATASPTQFDLGIHDATPTQLVGGAGTCVKSGPGFDTSSYVQYPLTLRVEEGEQCKQLFDSMCASNGTDLRSIPGDLQDAVEQMATTISGVPLHLKMLAEEIGTQQQQQQQCFSSRDDVLRVWDIVRKKATGKLARASLGLHDAAVCELLHRVVHKTNSILSDKLNDVCVEKVLNIGIGILTGTQLILDPLTFYWFAEELDLMERKWLNPFQEFTEDTFQEFVLAVLRFYHRIATERSQRNATAGTGGFVDVTAAELVPGAVMNSKTATTVLPVRPSKKKPETCSVHATANVTCCALPLHHPAFQTRVVDLSCEPCYIVTQKRAPLQDGITPAVSVQIKFSQQLYRGQKVTESHTLAEIASEFDKFDTSAATPLRAFVTQKHVVDLCEPKQLGDWECVVSNDNMAQFLGYFAFPALVRRATDLVRLSTPIWVNALDEADLRLILNFTDRQVNRWKRWRASKPFMSQADILTAGVTSQDRSKLPVALQNRLLLFDSSVGKPAGEGIC